ncbi:heavy metal-associated isoprenylated plant protein 28-like isoform X2 [Ananas comosus]|uniref:Heavy metal-associated isoprenylated plant protein 28-like isoform X2 n=1 Tax=Ananas comosus TaxID=4615 RepID=A0A6P5FTP4_ANACO|nr:heavy metal-associated isoprenylated plant protein 28-like isoform X2 [Ananas comosus]
MTIVEICVHMDCAGCESKIRKAIRKLEGVDSVEIDMGQQKVTVTGWIDQKKVLKAVRKTGRRAVFWPYPYIGDQFTPQQYYHRDHHPALARSYVASPSSSSSSSSYNYYNHGYDDDSHMYGYHNSPAHAGIVGERASDVFSDENAHGCSIM